MTTDLQSPAKLRLRTEDVSWTATDDGGIVALDLRTSLYLSVSPSAARLWAELASGCTLEGLAASLVDAYAIPAGQATADCAVFVKDLFARDLITVDP